MNICVSVSLSICHICHLSYFDKTLFVFWLFGLKKIYFIHMQCWYVTRIKIKGNKLTYSTLISTFNPTSWICSLFGQTRKTFSSKRHDDSLSKPDPVLSRDLKSINELMTSGRMGACEDGGGRDESWSRNFRFCSGLQTRYALRCCRNTQIRKFTRVLLWMWRCYVVCVYLN